MVKLMVRSSNNPNMGPAPFRLQSTYTVTIQINESEREVTESEVHLIISSGICQELCVHCLHWLVKR